MKIISVLAIVAIIILGIGVSAVVYFAYLMGTGDCPSCAQHFGIRDYATWMLGPVVFFTGVAMLIRVTANR